MMGFGSPHIFSGLEAADSDLSGPRSRQPAPGCILHLTCSFQITGTTRPTPISVLVQCAYITFFRMSTVRVLQSRSRSETGQATTRLVLPLARPTPRYSIAQRNHERLDGTTEGGRGLERTAGGPALIKASRSGMTGPGVLKASNSGLEVSPAPG